MGTITAQAEFEIKGIRKAGEVEVGDFEGYASTFGNSDVVGDVIEPGAFKGAVGKTFPLLWQHSMDEPIGKIVRLSEDSDGLYVTGEVNLGTVKGRDAYALLKANHLDTMSIGFTAPPGGVEPRDDGGRTFTKINLLEISLVTIPANPKAIVTSVKDIDPALMAQTIATQFGCPIAEAQNVVKTGLAAVNGGSIPAPAVIKDAMDEILRMVQTLKG